MTRFATTNTDIMAALLQGNEDKKTRLAKIIADGDIFLMAGAGISMMLDLPSWDGLISIMENHVLTKDPKFIKRQKDIESITEYTDRLVTALGDGFPDLISDTFGNQYNPLDTHISLVSLPFKAILTTNYDRIMVASVSAASKTYVSPVVFSEYTSGRETAKFLQAINSSSLTPKVIHLHGYCDIPESIILSASHYQKKYGIKILKAPTAKEHSKFQDESWPFLRKIMWALMATRRILYVGFSMSDNYFKIMHEIVSEDARQGGIEMHYIIQRIPPRKDGVSEEEYEKQIVELDELAKFFSSKYGIQTVFYLDDKAYTGLPNLIEEIKKKVESIKGNGFSASTVPEDVNISVEENSKPKMVYEKLLELAKLNANNND